MQNEQNVDSGMYKKMADKITSSPDIINNIVKEGLEWASFDTERIVEGLSNEVYQVSSSNDSVILRIHHGKYPKFEQEKWFMEQASKCGVPTPSVLKIGSYFDGDKELTYSFQTLVHGEPLNKLLDQGMSNEELKYYGYQAGQILAKIHQVKTQNYGHFTNQVGIAQFKTLAESMEQHTDRDKLLEAIVGTEVSPKELDEMIEIIDQIKTEEEPHLIHVDYAPKHIFVSEKQITGVIDWEICMSGIAAADLNRWRTQDNRIKMVDLIEGYESIKPLLLSFWSVLCIVQLHSALRTILYHFNITKSDAGILKAVEEAKFLLQSNKSMLN